MRFSDRTRVTGYLLAFLVGGLMAETNLEVYRDGTLWWSIGVFTLWVYLVLVDVKRRLDYLESKQYKEAYHV